MDSASLTQKIASIDDKKYQYIDTEVGEKTIIMLHGLGSCKESFIPILDRIGDTRYIFLDLPGHNGLDSQGVYTLDAFADYIIDFVKEFQLKKVGFIGFSLGGLIALKITEKFENERITPSVIWASPLKLKHHFVRPHIARNMLLSGQDSKLFREKTNVKLKSPLLYIFSPDDTVVTDKYIDEIPLDNRDHKVVNILGGGHFGTMQGVVACNKEITSFFTKHL